MLDVVSTARPGAPDSCFAAAAGTGLDLRATRAQLAARLGTVWELVARELAQLEAGGVIAREGPTLLAALAHGEASRLPVGE